MIDETTETQDQPRTTAWDLPLRLFHWALVGAVVTSVVTGKTGDMDIHMLSGFTILTLVLFRIAWGFAGGRHARFGDFVRGPGTVIGYLRSQAGGGGPNFVGHNPAGGLSVLAMLAVLALQTGTGLFANDDILTEGPLMKFIDKDTSDFVTWVHYLSSNALIVLIVLHLSAIALYRFRGENLVWPMITGMKKISDTGSGSEKGAKTNPRGNALIALILFAAAAAAVYYIVNL